VLNSNILLRSSFWLSLVQVSLRFRFKVNKKKTRLVVKIVKITCLNESSVRAVSIGLLDGNLLDGLNFEIINKLTNYKIN
jgi:hypothetical protein